MVAEIDIWSSIGLVVAVLAAGVVLTVADRIPKLTKVLVLLGAIVLLVAVVYSVLAVPALALPLVGIFIFGNLMHVIAGTTSRFRTKPADLRAESVWAEEVATVVSQGWEHRGTWIFDGGQTRPVWSIAVRPTDGTHVGMLGTAPHGGMVTVETLLDEGRGLLVTLRRPSSLVRPPWMFRQAIKGASLTEMIRHHDDALFFLQAHGIRAGARVPGDPFEFERFTNGKLRRHVWRRWWLWAIRPIARRFGPRTTGPVHEQPAIGKQIEKYRKGTKAESTLTSSVG